MRFARVHKFAAYLLAGLGLIALCAGGELGTVATALLAIGFVGSWFVEGTLQQSARYVRTWNIVIVSVLVLEILRALFAGLAPVTAAVEFAALLQLSRLSNRRTARDYQHITVLAMLHLIAATVLGEGLSYAACFIGFVIVTPWAMTLGHLRREIEGNYLADARAGRAGVPIDVARILHGSRRVVGPGLLIGSSLLAIPVFAITAVIFVVFPRVGLGIFSIRPGHANHVAGLGDQVDLRGHGTIRDDPTIVLRIEPPDLGAHPPDIRPFRLRGAAFDHYDGRTWTRSAGQRGNLVRDASVYEIRAYPEGPRFRPYRIVVDALEPPVVLVPEGTVALRVEPRVEAGLPHYADLSVDAAGEIHYANNDDLGLVYTAYVGPSDRPDVLPEPLRPRYLALPGDLPPRIATLAHQLTDSVLGTVNKANAVESFLRRFRYTLDIESGNAEQPLDDFLFRTRAGHCEYFSTAMAVLLRAVGIPTRNVTGFLGGTFNRWGNFYAVREGDAHSWVEVYDDSLGWVTFDPTPSAREQPTVQTGALAQLDEIIEALRVRWRRYIVSFDLGTQARIAMRLMHYFDSRPRRGYHRAAHDAQTPAPSFDSIGRWAHDSMREIVVAAMLVALGIVMLRRRRVDPRASANQRRQARTRDAIALAEALDMALRVAWIQPPANAVTRWLRRRPRTPWRADRGACRARCAKIRGRPLRRRPASSG